jgi:hypothetical protein
VAQVHEPSSQVVPCAQTFPQVPQLFESVLVSTHWPAHAVVPGAGHTHFPPSQVSVDEHNTPQLPQLLRSAFVSTQVAPQAASPTAQVDTQADFEQVCPEVQAWPHVPQLATSLVRSVQAEPHSVVPPLQVATGGVHTPLEQVQFVGQSESTLQLMVTLDPQLVVSSAKPTDSVSVAVHASVHRRK